MVQFWNVLYENVLLEYMYVNRLKWPVPELEVKRDDCRVAGSVDTASTRTAATASSAATVTATIATVSKNGSDDSSVLVNEKHGQPKVSCSTSSSVKFSEEPSSATADINDNVEVDVEVEIGSNRKQLIPLGGTYVHNMLIVLIHNSHSN
jgi:hypothetical protein